MAEEVEDIKKKLDTVLFKKKTFSAVLEEVYTKSNQSHNMLFDVIGKFNQFLDKNDSDDESEGPSLGTALQLAPHIGTYMKLSLDSNKQLIEMLSVIQKLFDKNKQEKKEEDEDEATKLKLSPADRKMLEQLELEYQMVHSLPPATQPIAEVLPTKAVRVTKTLTRKSE